MLPGRMSSCAGALCFGCTTETESTAICAVTAVNDFSSFIRDRIPATNTPTTNSTSNAVSNQRRRKACDLRSWEEEVAPVRVVLELQFASYHSPMFLLFWWA